MTNQRMHELKMALFLAFAILLFLPSAVSAAGATETEDIIGLDQAFKKDLVAATIYFFKEGFLYIDLKYDSGTMKFGR